MLKALEQLADNHADDIVRIYREVFGKGYAFCQKITYRTSSVRIVEMNPQPDGIELEEISWQRASSLSPDEILSGFRNSYHPRIAVTVDMIATSIDIPASRGRAISKHEATSQSPAASRDNPLEIGFFMRSVASKIFFEQMKGRGMRVLNPDYRICYPWSATYKSSRYASRR